MLRMKEANSKNGKSGRIAKRAINSKHSEIQGSPGEGLMLMSKGQRGARNSLVGLRTHPQ